MRMNRSCHWVFAPVIGFVVVPLGRDRHGGYAVRHLSRQGEVTVAAAEFSWRYERPSEKIQNPWELPEDANFITFVCLTHPKISFGPRRAQKDTYRTRKIDSLCTTPIHQPPDWEYTSWFTPGMAGHRPGLWQRRLQATFQTWLCYQLKSFLHVIVIRIIKAKWVTPP